MLGAAWYPEQWPESQWESDLALMEAAHINFVRVAEFAWSTMEPKEGDYQLDWLERAVRAAEKHHIAVVLGTPSAAPPAWLTQKYPETLRTKEDGRKDDDALWARFRAALVVTQIAPDHVASGLRSWPCAPRRACRSTGSAR